MSHTRGRRSVIIVTVVSAWTAHLLAWAASVLATARPGVPRGGVNDRGHHTGQRYLHRDKRPARDLGADCARPAQWCRVDGLPPYRPWADRTQVAPLEYLCRVPGFCALGIFSFGFLYLPAALALVIAALDPPVLLAEEKDTHGQNGTTDALQRASVGDHGRVGITHYPLTKAIGGQTGSVEISSSHFREYLYLGSGDS